MEKDIRYKSFIEKNPMKWNISIIGGKDINNNSVSTGEGIWKDKKIKFFLSLLEIINADRENLCIVNARGGDSPVSYWFNFSKWVKHIMSKYVWIQQTHFAKLKYY